MKTVVVHPDGTAEAKELPENPRTLQQVVGGYLEAVYGAHDEYGKPQVVILVNEDGIPQQLPMNDRATALWWAIDPMVRGTRALFGVAVVCGGPDEEGRLKDVPGEVVEMLTS